MRVALVTGAGGLIGGRLCRRLQEEGWRVRALLRRPRSGPWDDAMILDLSVSAPDPRWLEGGEVLFHLAAHVPSAGARGDDETLYRQVNVEGTHRLMASVVQAGVGRVVYAGSVKAMGEGGEACGDETAVPCPVTPYGRSKLAAERMVLSGGVSGSVVRLPPVYGPGDRGNMARMIRAVAGGYFPPLPVWDNRRSLVHVDDAVAAMILAAVLPGAVGEVFLVTDGEIYSTRGMHEAIRAALGLPPLSWSVPMGVMRGLAWVGDGWAGWTGRRMPLDSGVLETLVGSAWYRDDKIRHMLGYVPRWNLVKALPELLGGGRV